ncbi:glycosyl transferase family 17 [Caballeronia insecticola]|uniref:Glycosyl transferase family 17 n=2 Tax=Caballeronia insecticola TaxID=758793 RepID=R4WHG8_9BURK|nr:glycosyl transferase family 17 [Caballeronia insecticola]
MTQHHFDRITLVSVTGLADAQGAAYALALSLRQMPGARALLCCPHPPSDLPPGIRHCRIAPLNYHEYSWFMMFALWRLIETDYVLTVQSDGWVLDASNWTDSFFEYDYIGAPTHIARIQSEGGAQWVQGYSWYERLGQPGQVITPVLNGGFSLRSRKMLRALIDHRHIKVELNPPDDLIGEPLRMQWVGAGPNEDVQLTVVLREQLQAAGLRFAPLDLAMQFSIEHSGPLHRVDTLARLFGHHGQHRRLVSIDPPVVRYPVAQDRFEGTTEMAVAEHLQRIGYRVEFVQPQAAPAAAVA